MDESNPNKEKRELIEMSNVKRTENEEFVN